MESPHTVGSRKYGRTGSDLCSPSASTPVAPTKSGYMLSFSVRFLRLQFCFCCDSNVNLLRVAGYPIVGDQIYNSTVWGPTKGRGAEYAKSYEKVHFQLVARHLYVGIKELSHVESV